MPHPPCSFLIGQNKSNAVRTTIWQHGIIHRLHVAMQLLFLVGGEKKHFGATNGSLFAFPIIKLFGPAGLQYSSGSSSRVHFANICPMRHLVESEFKDIL